MALTCHALSWLTEIPGHAVIYSCLLSLGRMENRGIISSVHPQYRSWSFGPTAEDLQKRASDLCQSWKTQSEHIFYLLQWLNHFSTECNFNAAIVTLQIVPPPNTCHWLSCCCCARLVEMFIKSKSVYAFHCLIYCTSTWHFRLGEDSILTLKNTHFSFNKGKWYQHTGEKKHWVRVK